MNDTSNVHELKGSFITVKLFTPFLDAKGKEIEQRFVIKEGETPDKRGRVETEGTGDQKFKAQYITLMLSNVVGDALTRFIQEPPRPIGQVDYRELSRALNKLNSSQKPKIKREELNPVFNAVNKLQIAQDLINEKTNAILKGTNLLMLARLATKIYSSEEAIELTKEQVEFIIKAIDKTNNGIMIMRVCNLLDPEDKLNVLS